MEERKWEDLEMDCLVNVLSRVGMESRLLDVPFVCKSWHKASLNPLSWQHLVFPKDSFSFSYEYDSFEARFEDQYGIKKLSYTAFIKFIIDRSCGTATTLIFPEYCTAAALQYAANECPLLKVLGLPSHLCRPSVLPSITELIGKWKNLELLVLESSSLIFSEMLAQISLNCKNFGGLLAHNTYITEKEASTIVISLPKIKYLSLRGASIERENLVTILKGCKELDYLDVSNCVGYEADDELLKIASHIRIFKYEGSRLYDGDWSDGVIEHDDIYDGYYSD